MNLGAAKFGVYTGPMMIASDPAAFLSRLATMLPPERIVTDADTLAPWLTDWRGRVTGRALALASPISTDEVARLVRLAAETGTAIVPQGGNTSMVGGATPDASGGAVLLSLRRMACIRSVSVEDGAIVAEAGVILEDLHRVAEAAGLRFPLSLAAKGSATVGGLVSTNAGGTQVLRFGPMRSQVLGIEAVLPDGSVLDSLSPLRKDNRGYDLKSLLVGAEGTLGIVTAATVRLVPPVNTATAWIGLSSPAEGLTVLRQVETLTGGAVESFELVPRVALDLVHRHLSATRAPLARPAPWNALIEIGTAPAMPAPGPILEQALATCAERDLLLDATVAQSAAQAQALWALREGVPEAERKDGLAAKHDIAVPVSLMPAFILSATRAVEARFPGTRVIAFGHLGDGNVHFNVRAPAEIEDRKGWLAAEGDTISRFVHDLVTEAGGTISAEHGIGQFKRNELLRVAGGARLGALLAIKAALDPRGIMNPGKLVPLASRTGGQ